MIVGLAGHVSHGEGYRCAVGNGHCRGHKKELNVTDSQCFQKESCLSLSSYLKTNSELHISLTDCY